MKLRNKKTGVIGYTAILQSKAIIIMDENAIQLGRYVSLAELNAEWEDYKEPKEYWMVDTYTCEITYLDEGKDEDVDNFNKQIGNYFETKEEAEKAVEKLKAVKRLKDAGCRVTEYKTYGGSTSKGEFIGEVKIILDVPDEIDKELLCLLFGGEE